MLADAFWEPRLYSPSALGIMEGVGQSLGGTIQPLVRSLAVAQETVATEQLPVLYSSLFLGPFAIQAPPYASVYLAGESAFNGLVQTEVRSYYLQGGFDLSPQAMEAPDHISVELEFLYATLARFLQQEAVEALELACDFCRNHCQTWLPGFAKALTAAPGARFYAVLASLCQETVRQLGSHSPELVS